MAITGVTDFANGLRHVTVSHDPTVSVTDAPKGSIIIEETTGSHFIKVDDGPSTNVMKTADVTIDISAHAGRHTDGSDDIQSATAGQKGVATAAQITKLNGIEAAADVTDAVNVAAAGAIMDGDVAGGDLGGTLPSPTVNAGADGSAIHEDVDGEIAAITEKVTPLAADVIIIESAADSNAKRRAQLSNLPVPVVSADDVAKTAGRTWAKMSVLLPGVDSESGAVYAKAAAFIIDFDELPTTVAKLVLHWDQISIGPNTAQVRLRNITDGTTLAELLAIGSTGLKSAVFTAVPTGVKRVELQHSQTSSGGGSVEIEGAVLMIAGD